MRNNSKRNLNNSLSKFYTPSLQKHLEHYFEQSNVPQELLGEDKLYRLLESTELYIEITNHGFQIQALNYEKSFHDQEEISTDIEEQSAIYSRPKEETPLNDPEISPEPVLTQVHIPYIPNPETTQQPTELH
ncbi:unnamed protein product [Malus baccata var. baccata]